jgi:hypothetical protein
MTWHADTVTLKRYFDGDLSEAYSCSVEAHMLECGSCRGALAGIAAAGAADNHEQTWGRVLDVVDRPTSSRVTRIFTRWFPEHVVRLVAAAPELRDSACGAGLALLGVAVVVANLRGGAGGTAVFLVTAPVVPLVGVALAYAYPDDLCGEIASVVPYSRFRLLLMRTAAVAGLTIPVVLLLGLALPVDVWVALLWLAPALALCALTLALSTVADARLVAAVLTGLWVVATNPTLRAARLHLDPQQLVERSAVFQPTGQMLLLCVAVLAVSASAIRRSSFEMRSAR